MKHIDVAKRKDEQLNGLGERADKAKERAARLAERAVRARRFAADVKYAEALVRGHHKP